MIVNLVFAGAKILGGLPGNAYVLIADGIEAALDIAGSLVIWRGLRLAARPPDETHPYGHGKAEPIAAAVVSTMLLLGALWITVEAARGIARPRQGPAPFTLLVLVIVVCLKEGLFRFVRRESLLVDSSAVQTDAWHHRSDAITSLAAAIGISVSLLGGKGYESADDVAAVLAASIIAWNGWRLLRPALNELMDTSPSRELVGQIRLTAEAVDGVERVEKCMVRKSGDHFFVDLHVEVDPQMTVQRSHDIAHMVKNRVRAQLPAVRDVLVHIEPSTRARAQDSRQQRAI